MSDAGLNSQEKAYFGSEVLEDAGIADGAPSPAETSTGTAAEQPESTETSTPAKGDAVKTPEDQKYVPLPALHEERERRRELQKQLQEQAQQQARMEERFNIFMQAVQAQQQPQEQPRSVEEDPVGALKRIEQWANMTAQQQLQAQQFTMRQQAEAQQYEQLRSAVERAETSFRQEHPDYDDALKYAMGLREIELKALGVPAHIIPQRVMQDAREIAQHALSIGRSPAELAYDYAQSRGYKAAAPAAAAPSAEEKMAMLEKGTAAAKSLSSGSGGEADITLATISKMDEDEFDDFVSKMTPAQMRKIAGPGSR